MKFPSGNYAELMWYPWYAEVAGVLGEDEKKIRAAAVRLMRIPRKVWWSIVRAGGAPNLRGAYLENAVGNKQ